MLHRKLFVARRRASWLPRGACLAALLLAAAPPALGQPAAVTYPASRAPSDVAAWLQRDTPLMLGQVVDVGPSAVTAITSVTPTGAPRGFIARTSSEALAPQIVSDEGVASWTIPVDVDCERRLVRLGEMTGYRGRDLKTDGKVVRAANPEWVSPVASAPLGAVIGALCDRDFKRPFAGRRFALAKPPAVEPAHKPARVAEAAPPPPPLRSTLLANPAASPPPPPPQPKAEAKAEAPKGGGTIAVQIGASPSGPEIEALLARFRKTHTGEMEGLRTDTATVELGGKTIHRALIVGFASSAEANGFCKKLAAEGQACFIRR